MTSPIQFNPGQVYATPGAIALGVDLTPFLDRHIRGDWGEMLGFEDVLANERALADGERILSKYEARPGVAIYVITEWNRQVTTVLLPEEY